MEANHGSEASKLRSYLRRCKEPKSSLTEPRKAQKESSQCLSAKAKHILEINSAVSKGVADQLLEEATQAGDDFKHNRGALSGRRVLHQEVYGTKREVS